MSFWETPKRYTVHDENMWMAPKGKNEYYKSVNEKAFPLLKGWGSDLHSDDSRYLSKRLLVSIIAHHFHRPSSARWNGRESKKKFVLEKFQKHNHIERQTTAKQVVKNLSLLSSFSVSCGDVCRIYANSERVRENLYYLIFFSSLKTRFIEWIFFSIYTTSWISMSLWYLTGKINSFLGGKKSYQNFADNARENFFAISFSLPTLMYEYFLHWC